MGSDKFGVLILAAGKGTRMHSEKPKVLQPLLEEPVLYYIIDTVRKAGYKNIAVLVGHRGDMVEAYVRSEWPDVEVIWQKEQLGTGHAVRSAMDWWIGFDDVMVLNGDVPLVREKTLHKLFKHHELHESQCTMITVEAADPTGYGRVVRLADGGVRIIEHKEASEDELSIREVNAGLYVFDTKALRSVIDSLSPANSQNEYYLTDAVHMISDTEGSVSVYVCPDEAELQGINTPYELAATARTLNDRILKARMMEGLKCLDPTTTWIGPRVEFEPDVVIEPGVQIWGASKIGAGTRVGANTTILGSVIGRSCSVIGPCVIFDTKIGDSVDVGPFAYLRDGVVMGSGSRAGRFVEIKNSSIGAGAKVPHLSYIGDATIGDGTNIGAGTITCNYDGTHKHTTKIGANCFVGSDTMFVAPVAMGDGAATAAGSVITDDIPAGALGIARERQKNIDGWSRRKGSE